jgi:flagellar protein FlgJ
MAGAGKDIAGTAAQTSVQVSAAKPITQSKTSRAPTESQSSFVQKHSQIASEIEKATGIPAGFMLGQAGHETGWGKHEIKVKGGEASHNLFGIKAGAGWTGKVAEVTTTEFVDGAPQKRVARFRAYDSYADAFKDYARMISDSPRYAKARAQTGSAQAFASGLQKAGYATDPDYAAKLSRAINTTLQIRRAQA